MNYSEKAPRAYQRILQEEEKHLHHYSYLDNDGRIVDIPRCLAYYRAYSVELCREKAREYGHAVALYSVNASGRIYYSRHIDIMTKKQKQAIKKLRESTHMESIYDNNTVGKIKILMKHSA